MSDVIAEHVSRVGTEVMSPQLAFVGLLHVIAENSNKSRCLTANIFLIDLIIEPYRDQLFIARDVKLEAESSENDDMLSQF